MRIGAACAHGGGNAKCSCWQGTIHGPAAATSKVREAAGLRAVRAVGSCLCDPLISVTATQASTGVGGWGGVKKSL